MAIEKHTFTATKTNIHLNELRGWFESNATEYFDSFETAENNTLICKIGETEALKFAESSSELIVTVSLPNGVSVSNYAGRTSAVFKYAKKTNSGIYLYSSYIRIFITKSDKDSTSVLLSCFSSNSSQKSYIADFGYSSTFIEVPHTTAVTANELTSFAPVVCSGCVILPNLFITPFSEYVGNDCNLNFRGTEYVYDGYFALKE